MSLILASHNVTLKLDLKLDTKFEALSLRSTRLGQGFIRILLCMSFNSYIEGVDAYRVKDRVQFPGRDMCIVLQRPLKTI